MTFKRAWDSSCPRIWDSWEADGVKWVIQDLAPEDDDKALKMFVEQFIPDEVLCITSGMLDDQTSIDSMAAFWAVCLAQRMSLGCYVESGGHRTLVAINCCIVAAAGAEALHEIEGEAWINTYEALQYMSSRADVYKLLGVDTVLNGMGLLVRKDYRGARLGAKVLQAREPLCRSLGLEGTSTVFSGPGSQKSAERAGFSTVAQASLRDLADAGLKYPRDDSRVIKLMVKKY